MKQVRETSYLRILRPTLEYRAQTLENVQRRAARFVINDYTSRTQGCVTSMLTSLEVDQLPIGPIKIVCLQQEKWISEGKTFDMLCLFCRSY
jgi:hypothetical protein